MQQKSGLKNLVLERKLEAVGDQLEKKEAQLGEVLSASNLDPGTLQQVTKKLDEVLDSKNGRFLSVRLEIHATGPEQLQALHAELKATGKVHMVL